MGERKGTKNLGTLFFSTQGKRETEFSQGRTRRNETNKRRKGGTERERSLIEGTSNRLAIGGDSAERAEKEDFTGAPVHRRREIRLQMA